MTKICHVNGKMCPNIDHKIMQSYMGVCVGEKLMH